MTSKSDLRKKLRYDRHEFVLKRQNSSILSNNAHIGPLRDLVSSACCVACYHDVIGEPNLDDIATYAHRQGVQIALPWLPPIADKIAAREAGILFRQWTPGDPLQQTTLGFHEPDDLMPLLDPDLILTPLVGFDRSLNRLGQGAGHYDRAFQNWPDAIRVGVAWSVQEVDDLPVDPWDVPLDAILTEREWITGPKGRIDQ